MRITIFRGERWSQPLLNHEGLDRANEMSVEGAGFSSPTLAGCCRQLHPKLVKSMEFFVVGFFFFIIWTVALSPLSLQLQQSPSLQSRSGMFCLFILGRRYLSL